MKNTVKQCPNCHLRTEKEDDFFCSQCGTILEILPNSCEVCKAELGPDMKFCSKCGAKAPSPVQPSQERINRIMADYLYDKGKAINLTNPDASFRCMKKAAELGRNEAIIELGIYYYNQKNYEEAVECFRKTETFARSKYMLGMCYLLGKSDEKDEKEAVKWFKEAAEQGDTISQLELGECYLFGKGVEKDEKEAVKWFKEAAEQGHGTAIYRLREMGVDVSEYKPKQRKWS